MISQFIRGKQNDVIGFSEKQLGLTLTSGRRKARNYERETKTLGVQRSFPQVFVARE